MRAIKISLKTKNYSKHDDLAKCVYKQSIFSTFPFDTRFKGCMLEWYLLSKFVQVGKVECSKIALKPRNITLFTCEEKTIKMSVFSSTETDRKPRIYDKFLQRSP